LQGWSWQVLFKDFAADELYSVLIKPSTSFFRVSELNFP